MITTNLAVFILTLSTNVVTTDNGKVGCPNWDASNHDPNHTVVLTSNPPRYEICEGQPIPATLRTVTTTVMESTTVLYRSDGEDKWHSWERIVSEDVERFVAVHEWKPAPKIEPPSDRRVINLNQIIGTSTNFQSSGWIITATNAPTTNKWWHGKTIEEIMEELKKP